MKKIILVLVACGLLAVVLNACSSDYDSSYSSSRSSYSDDTDWAGAAEAYSVGKARYDAMTGQ